MQASPAFEKQMAGYGLTTAEILYRMPDHPALLQSYLWQDYDLFPEFPTLKKFLDFWTRTLDGPLFRITVGHRALIKPVEFKAVGAEFRLA
ncbi:usg protein [uncultured Phenylobacterium sp.]|uniref:usg protein n=1 Tax=uncultured Phenylobacterium sp. TaxID=349273 RepID=UPI002600F801|nr:usg protein [uncultured Phenylobacterium sp.]